MPLEEAIAQQQQEENEVLLSIYDRDECFKMLSDVKYQYKIQHEDCEAKSFLVEVEWGEKYPDEAPTVSLDAFYNKHIISEVKTHIISQVLEQAEMMLGCAMTYTLFEWVKEHHITLTTDQPGVPPPDHTLLTDTVTPLTHLTVSQDTNTEVKARKVQLTKAQKRRLADKVNAAGERPRGWDWVDIVRHLSQTGGKNTS